MLFDLRGRGRRTTVRIIYGGLALLIGLGLVGFGIGGGFGGGGFLNAASQNEGGGSVSFSSRIKKYEKLTKQQPANVSAWENLVKAQLNEAGGEAYVGSSGLTSKGRELFSKIAQSWNSYLALNPPKPNGALAQQMLRIFGEEGLARPADEVQVLQLVVAEKPTNAALYGELAAAAYKAHNPRVAGLAAAKAVALAPSAQRQRVKTELATLKKSATGGGETYTGTTNGKPFTVKPGGNGTLTGTVPRPTTAPPAPAKK
ncbi:MAG TPA: hypothetical protein VNY34_02025 [Solirubrobacteraceae bacterium]|jgi:hypothetical protein|nr:hypothetical protein [Solirubrobacteraceae bacterium]